MKDKIDKIFNTSYKTLDPINNIDKSKQDYNEAYQRFRELMSLVVDFAEQQEPIKKLDDDKVAITLLCQKEKKLKNECFLREYYTCGLYAMKNLCIDLLKYTKSELSNHYKSLMLDVIGDIQWVLSAYEFYRIKDKTTKPERRISVSRRSSLDLNDRREVIRTMFWLEQFSEISTLSVRDIRPHMQIVIRQALEMIFKDIIGYDVITDKSGQRDRKSTQAGCDFLQRRRDKQYPNTCVAKGAGWELSMPIPLKTIEMINSWCNNFTHDPWIVGIHIQHYLYCQYERIVRGWIITPKVNIIGVDNMRADFETYMAEKNSGAIVRWPKDAPEHYKDVLFLNEIRRRVLEEEIANLEKAIIKRKTALSEL